VQAEEQRPLRRVTMKPGEPGDHIQTLGENASTWEQTDYHYYTLGGQKEVFFS
jgi:hypothetical protein